MRIENKKILIFIIIIVLFLISMFLYGLYHRAQPQRVIEKNLTTTITEEAESFLSESFLSEIENESGVNREHYQEAVRDYELIRKINSIRMEDKNTAIINSTSITKNLRTGFTLESREIYRAVLIKENGNWRIDSYELLSSESN